MEQGCTCVVTYSEKLKQAKSWFEIVTEADSKLIGFMGISEPKLVDMYVHEVEGEARLPEGTKVKSNEDDQIYTIHDSTWTNNQFGYGVYRYRVKERLDKGFALHKKWFEVIK